MQGVYKISSLAKPERVYVGSSKNIRNRWWAHLSDLKKGKHHSRKMQRHFNKYGQEDLIFEVLEHVQNANALISVEQKYIDSISPFFNAMKKAGSCLGYKHTDESRQRMSEARKKRKTAPETRLKMSIARKGRIISDYQRQRIIETNKTRVLSPESIEKLRRAHTGMKKHTPESLAKISPLGRKHKPETIEKMRVSALMREKLKREAA